VAVVSERSGLHGAPYPPVASGLSQRTQHVLAVQIWFHCARSASTALTPRQAQLGGSQGNR